MDEQSVIQYITEELGGVDVVEASGDRYFFYDPGGGVEPERMFPFATLVTGDRHDTASNLGRPGVYRLNIGVQRDTYRALFGEDAPRTGADGIGNTGHDFAALDQLMPHPVYASQFWVCVLNPSEKIFERVKPLLAEAHDRAARRDGRKRGTG